MRRAPSAVQELLGSALFWMVVQSQQPAHTGAALKDRYPRGPAGNSEARAEWVALDSPTSICQALGRPVSVAFTVLEKTGIGQLSTQMTAGQAMQATATQGHDVGPTKPCERLGRK